MLLFCMLGVLVVSSVARADVHDFFTADQDPETERYLVHVDNYHTNKVMQRIREENMNHALLEVQYTLDRFPNHPRGLMFMETVSRLRGVPEMAVNYYEKALLLYPQYALTHAQFGRYLTELNKVNEGIEHLKRAVELDHKLAPAYVWLAEAHQKSGKHDLAKKAGERARALGYTGALSYEPAVDKLTK